MAVQPESAPAIWGEGEQTKNTEVLWRPDEELADVEPVEVTEDEALVLLVSEEVDEPEPPA